MIVGIDFGTSNSVCAVRLKNGEIRKVILEPGSSLPYLLPSYWYFLDADSAPIVGQKARAAFIENSFDGRFIVSLKSHFSNLQLRSINIYGKMVSLERIASFVLKKIKNAVEEQFGEIKVVHAGRPVVLSEDSTIDKQIEDRLREAYKLAGLPDPMFVAEPVAAAFEYKRRLKESEVVFIADFGGGTLDYCLAKLEPTNSLGKDIILGTSGIRIGGDDFTGALMKLFWDYFGFSSHVRDFSKTKWMSFPIGIFHELSSWRNIWRLERAKTDIEACIKWGSSDPEALKRLIALLDPECYFEFFEQLEKLKIGLSNNERSHIRYIRRPIEIDEEIDRLNFEMVTTEMILKAKNRLLSVFNGTDLQPNDVNSVFLTGGSSQMPNFKRVVEEIFGKEKIRSGDAFTSVAEGLAFYEQKYS